MVIRVVIGGRRAVLRRDVDVGCRCGCDIDIQLHRYANNFLRLLGSGRCRDVLSRYIDPCVRDGRNGLSGRTGTFFIHPRRIDATIPPGIRDRLDAKRAVLQLPGSGGLPAHTADSESRERWR